ncbi:FG-GAP and VCBS repeat-containing protein [Streptomyces meridianus]|uniref:VCBS repeat-containing protein n=1 Tax=Streptomyces meridianus TaxID=2938945 RepID=A0ABT0X5J7_9ACTN|nr:FG-GAP and VCBS repeat-containing protein [Streptomyces meridianus]MCM2577812.1 VCBS repeat-containing protein [Streptomyces meridianus]
MRIRPLHTAAVGLAAALVSGAASTAAASPGAAPGSAQGAAASVHDDVDGDGYQDLVTAAPGGTVDGQTRAGYVVITYGSVSGLAPASRTTVISQNTPGVPGTAEEDDRFGDKLAARDLDGDGITDLVVSGLDQSGPDTYQHGTVTVLWGRPGGLTGEGAAGFRSPEGSVGWTVGRDLTAGDFNGDGHADLVMQYGDDWETRSVLFGPFNRSGTPASEQRIDMFSTDNDIWTLAAGDMTGDGIDDLATFYAYENHAEGGKFWRGTASGLSTTSTALPSAAATAIGDFDRDGRGDLAIRTVPNGIVEDLPGDHGTVKVLYGTADGPGSTRTTTITQNTSGVPGANERGDQFGARLDAGDANGDGFADLAVGVPFEAIGSKAAAGAVVLLKGGLGGIGGTGAQAFHQDTAGVAGVAEAGDRFGGAVRLLDTDRNGRADLAAGAPVENGTGAVWSLPGTSSGATATGSIAFNPVDLGTPAQGARFGANFAGENSVFLYEPWS